MYNALRKSSIAALCSIFLVAAATAQKQPLFDGKTLNGWRIVAGKAPFAVEDGMIVGTMVKGSPNTFLITEKEYGNFILELEVKLEGVDANSGIQTRSHYIPEGNKGNGLVYGRQMDIDATARAWTGGIYDEARRLWLYPLELNTPAKTAYKPQEFNHYKIACIGNETKVWVNGVPTAYVIDTLDETGVIGLQVHGIGNNDQLEGKKVYFKNITIQTKNFGKQAFPRGIYTVNFTPNTLSAYERQNGYHLLFDGKTNAGWMGTKTDMFPSKNWSILGGLLTSVPSDAIDSKGTGDIVTHGAFSAFDLSFEFRLTEGANSGVKYFVPLDKQISGAGTGLEYQLLDDAKHPDAKMGKDGNRTLASLYDLIAAKKEARFLRPIGNWNNARIIVYPNNKVEHYLNGVKVLSYERGSEAFKQLVSTSKYKNLIDFGQAPRGHILIQDHGDVVSFRTIKIKQL